MMEKKIRTSHKSKLPEGLSYSFGAEDISPFLIEFIEFDKMHISFADFWAPSKRKNKEEEKENRKFTIFRISYSPALSGPSIGRQSEKYPEFFAIKVHPIQSELKNEIRRKLVENNFDFVKKWLENYKKETWRLNRHEMIVYFNSKTKNFEIQE